MLVVIGQGRLRAESRDLHTKFQRLADDAHRAEGYASEGVPQQRVRVSEVPVETNLNQEALERVKVLAQRGKLASFQPSGDRKARKSFLAEDWKRIDNVE